MKAPLPQQNTVSPSMKEIGDFFIQKIKTEKEKEDNRRDLMQRQLKEVIGDRKIIISNQKINK